MPRRGEPTPPQFAPPPRRASTAEFCGLVVAAGQAAGALTLAALCIQGGGSGGTAGSFTGSTLLFLGVVFAALGLLVALTAWQTVRGSVAARFALVGAEAVLGAVGFLMIPTVGVVITVSAVVLVLLVTVFSGIGRTRQL